MQSGIGGIGKKRYRLKKVVSCRKKVVSFEKKWYRVGKIFFFKNKGKIVFLYTFQSLLSICIIKRKFLRNFFFLHDTTFFQTIPLFAYTIPFFSNDTAFYRYRRYHFAFCLFFSKSSRNFFGLLEIREIQTK